MAIITPWPIWRSDRCAHPPTFSEIRLRASFFLTTPAKKPRTECCCQSVAFMIAAIVVPLGSYSIFSTTDCLDGEDGADFDAAVFEAAGLGAAVGFGRTPKLLLAGFFAERDDLRPVFTDFDFDLLGPSVSPGINDSVMRCHRNGPAKMKAGRKGRGKT